jgi:hypothetical protein
VVNHRSAAPPPLDAGARSRRDPTLRRRRLGVAAALLTPLLAACGTGFQAQTNQIYQPGPGISVRSGGVYALNALIVTDGDGNGTLVTALINQGPSPDTLESVLVRTRSGDRVKTSILSGTVALPSRRAVQLADSGDVRVSGDLAAGSVCFLKLTFRNAAPVTVEIPIVSTSSVYHDVPLGPVPPPTTPSHSNPT